MIAANMANPETIQFSDFTEMNVSEYLKVYEEIVVADQYELMQQVFIELPAGARPYADLGGQLKKNVAAKLSDEAKRLRSAKLRLFKIRYKFDNREGSQTTMISACTLSLQKFECLSSNLPQKLWRASAAQLARKFWSFQQRQEGTASNWVASFDVTKEQGQAEFGFTD